MSEKKPPLNNHLVVPLKFSKCNQGSSGKFIDTVYNLFFSLSFYKWVNYLMAIYLFISNLPSTNYQWEWQPSCIWTREGTLKLIIFFPIADFGGFFKKELKTKCTRFCLVLSRLSLDKICAQRKGRKENTGETRFASHFSPSHGPFGRDH